MEGEDYITEGLKCRAKGFVLYLVGSWKPEQGGHLYQWSELSLGKLNLWLVI